MATEVREIVVPGELVDESGRMKPGANTYRVGDRIFATRLGVKSVRGDRVSVISLSGRYEAQRGDMVIGTVVEVGPSNWYINVGAAHDVSMHVNDVPWRVEFGETSKYLAVGDSVLLKVAHVDEMRKVQASMKDHQCRKLAGGVLVEVAPTKVPRIIGRGGSMIQMIKDMTATRMFVGQNGVIWVDGEWEDVSLATEALRMVEREAHTSGLTDNVRRFLEERRGVSYEEIKRRLRAEHPEREADEAPAEAEGEAGEPEPEGAEEGEPVEGDADENEESPRAVRGGDEED